MILVALWDKVHDLSKQDQDLLRAITYGQLEKNQANLSLQTLALIYLGEAASLH